MDVTKVFRENGIELEVGIFSSGSVKLIIDDEDRDYPQNIHLDKLEAYELAMFLLKNL